MSKFLGIITTVGIIAAIILFRINSILSMELALGAFIVWTGWAAIYEEANM